MNQRGFSSNYIFLIIGAVILISGIYLIGGLRINSKTVIPENTSCSKDEDCGLNICKCIAMNKNSIITKDKMCARFCEGTPSCVNNKCELIRKNDQCSTLDESTCNQSSKCKSNYGEIGPNKDSVGMPLDNFKFVSCVSLGQDEIDKISVENKKCIEDKGVWIKTKGNPTGICVK